MADQEELLVYQSDDGKIKLDVQLDGDSVWLSQDEIAKLFSTSRPNIVQHIQNIYREEELLEDTTCKKILRVVDNKRQYMVLHYNLDLIISVGYRVNSVVATRFRQWATQTLKEYMVKGFVMDDKRLAEANTFAGKDYFDELTERVRAIRLSERKFYQKVTDIFSQTSYDYDPGTDSAKEFFSTIQNKFHYAVTGKTAAELIASRINSQEHNAGLTVFAGTKPTVKDAKVAKNYMLEDELRRLYLISEQFLSFAELKMANKVTMRMADWQKKLDEMLLFNEFKVLADKGKVSHTQMECKVKQEMARYNKG